MRVFAGGVVAFLSGVTSCGGRGWEEGGQPALPGSAGLGRCPGDKMIDWVPRLGVRPLSLIRPPAWPGGARA